MLNSFVNCNKNCVTKMLKLLNRSNRYLRYFSSSITPKDSKGTSVVRSDSEWLPKDIKTHTGQIWDQEDIRQARFIDRPKQINEKFAIDLIEKVPPKACESRVVWCDGGHGALGHPRVYINLDKPGNHSCGYCGLRFYKNDQH